MIAPSPYGRGLGGGQTTTKQDKTSQTLHSPLHLAVNSLSVVYNYKFPVQAVHANQC